MTCAGSTRARTHMSTHTRPVWSTDWALPGPWWNRGLGGPPVQHRRLEAAPGGPPRPLPLAPPSSGGGWASPGALGLISPSRGLGRDSVCYLQLLETGLPPGRPWHGASPTPLSRSLGAWRPPCLPRDRARCASAASRPPSRPAGHQPAQSCPSPTLGSPSLASCIGASVPTPTVQRYPEPPLWPELV